MKIDFPSIFSESFETFKVFDDISVSDFEEDCVSSIWQTLNHLIIWQDFQLNKLNNLKFKLKLEEFESWVIQKLPKSQTELDKVVNKFRKQIDQFKEVLKELSGDEPYVNDKLAIIQESALHLSFHLGEIIYIRRANRNYPLPHEMKSFLR